MSPSTRARVRIGCSGWNYRSWREEFYDRAMPQTAWLAHYATVFDTAEINNSFYRLPDESVFSKWRQQVPRQFLFAVKASRFLTHMKRLRDPKEPIARLFSRIQALGSKLGPVLYQLPANFTIDLDRLGSLLETIREHARMLGMRRTVRTVLEFRDPSWYVSEVFDLLSRFGATMCLHDKLGSRIDAPDVGPFLYVRFHGTTGNYAGSYERQHLEPWARRLVDAANHGRPAFAYFNNDPGATSVRNALLLCDLVSRQYARPPQLCGSSTFTRSGLLTGGNSIA